MNPKKVGIGLSLIFLLAYFLRVMYLPSKSLTFGYDQARDGIQAQNIINGDLKILGPPASTPGMHHGVFWFYYLVPPNLISDGNPIASAYWNAFFNAAVVFVVFLLTKLMTKRDGPALIAAFLFAISFEATQYATWLSNPTTGIWSVPLIYLGLWMWISKEKNRLRIWGPLVVGLGMGLSVQANVFLLYHFVPVLLWIWIARERVSRADLAKFAGSGLLVVSTMIVSEIKFGFRSLSGVLSLLSSQDPIIASKNLGDFVVLFLNQLGDVFAFNSYPGNVGYGGVFVLVLIFVALYNWQKKESKKLSSEFAWQPFLAIWLLAHITVVSVGGASTPFLLVGIGPAVSILVGKSLFSWWEKRSKVFALFVFVLLVFGNLNMIVKENPKGQTIFAIQKDMLLSKQLEVIDYTYQESSGEAFSTNSLTSPLWINIVWSYLYDWYGKEKYGYVPQWHGKGQEGQLISLPYVEQDTQLYFLILEPIAGIPARYLDETIGEENSRSVLIEEKSWGELKVQKRMKL